MNFYLFVFIQLANLLEKVQIGKLVGMFNGVRIVISKEVTLVPNLLMERAVVEFVKDAAIVVISLLPIQTVELVT